MSKLNGRPPPPRFWIDDYSFRGESFIATKQFTPTDEAWEKYIDFSGMNQLDEVVSLDGWLCPTLLSEIKDDY